MFSEEHSTVVALALRSTDKAFASAVVEPLSLTVTAAVLPFGGGIGSPMYALFVIIVASYITAFGSSGGEKVLSVSSLDSSQGLFAYRRQL